jgi:hypothetical protein
MPRFPTYILILQHNVACLGGNATKKALFPGGQDAMRYMLTYDLMETARNTNEWLGATARAMASYPAFALSMNPMLTMTAAWGEVTERTFGAWSRNPTGASVDRGA